MTRIRFSISLLAAVALLLAACYPARQAPAVLATSVPVTGNNTAPTAAAPAATSAPAVTQTPASSIPENVTPGVKVSDQPITGGMVTIQSVDSPGPGWIVIHTNSNGAPGPIIGWTQVKPGVNTNVQVNIDPSKATSVLYAMLHTDAGVVGTYEFPGPDKPLMVNGQMVSPAFAVTGGSGGSGGAAAAGPTATMSAAGMAPTATGAASGYGNSPTAATATTAPASGGSSASGSATVLVANNPKLGKILVDNKGMTLYVFKKDAADQSNCTGGCLENWPPLLVSAGNPVAGSGVSGTLSEIKRADNGSQVTYNKQPLYYFAGDKAAGDVNGQGIGNAWFAATP